MVQTSLQRSFAQVHLLILLTAFNSVQLLTAQNRSPPIHNVIDVSESTVSGTILADLKHLIASHESINSSQTAINNSQIHFEMLDMSVNPSTKYSLHQRPKLTQFVTLDSNQGFIYLNTPIDREQLCPQLLDSDQPCVINVLLVAYTKFITADTINDLKSDTSMIYFDLSLNIIDINDNAPFFKRPKSINKPFHLISIKEEGPIGIFISLPHATDLDSRNHSITRYDLHPTKTAQDVREHFEVVNVIGANVNCDNVKPSDILVFNGSNDSNLLAAGQLSPIPCLRIAQRIDREVKDKYVFLLVAYDAGQKHGEISVHVTVTDINDHAPQWPNAIHIFDSSDQMHLIEAETHSTEANAQYVIPVKECTGQRKLVQLSATDLDAVESGFGKVTYSLSEMTKNVAHFQARIFISRDHIYLTELGLRGMSQANITIIVNAEDGAGKRNEAWFFLMIEDCNDHAPLILVSMQAATQKVLIHVKHIISFWN